MATISSIVITLCAIFPVWVVAIALGLITLVALIILIKIIAFVLEAIPFL